MRKVLNVNFRKTRLMRQGVRQRLAGLTANRKVNVIRSDFDLLKAILSNCVRLGPASQESREPSRLSGRILRGESGFVGSQLTRKKGFGSGGFLERIVWTI